MQTDKDLFMRLARIAEIYKKAPTEVLSDFLGAAEAVINKPKEPVKDKKPVARRKRGRMSAEQRKAISVGRRLGHARKLLAGLAG